MKFNKTHLLYIIAVVVLLGCNSAKEKPQTAQLCGNITNAKEDIATIISGDQKDTISLDSTGTFCFSLKLKIGKYLVFNHGNEITTLFIEPGDSLFITLNTAEFDETINYEGIGNEKNNFLAKNFLMNENSKVDYKILYSLPSDSFLIKINEDTQTEKNNLLEKGFSKEFTNAENLRILMEKSINKLNYPSYYEHFNDGIKPELPTNWYGFISEINVNDTQVKSTKDYNSYLQRLIGYKADNLLEKDSLLNARPHKTTASKMIIVNKLIEDVSSRNDLLFNFMNEQVKYYSINDLDQLLNDFSSFCADTSYIKKINEEIVKWEPLRKGQPAPGFTYKDINGKEYSLSDFHGKYVYIDVWATWCGPCLNEIPHLKKLIEEFKNKNIVFMSISVDDSQEAWKKMLIEDEMHGLQLFAPKAWKSSIIKDYMIGGIPRFMLIDTEGKIIDVRALRPSGDIKEIIYSLENI